LIDKEKLKPGSLRKNLDNWFSEKLKISKLLPSVLLNPLTESLLYVVGVQFGVGFRYFGFGLKGFDFFLFHTFNRSNFF